MGDDERSFQSETNLLIGRNDDAGRCEHLDMEEKKLSFSDGLNEEEAKLEESEHLDMQEKSPNFSNELVETEFLSKNIDGKKEEAEKLEHFDLEEKSLNSEEFGRYFQIEEKKEVGNFV